MPTDRTQIDKNEMHARMLAHVLIVIMSIVIYIEVARDWTGFTSYKTGNITGRYKTNATQNYTMTHDILLLMVLKLCIIILLKLIMSKYFTLCYRNKK